MTKNESTQPQLPPRSEARRSMDATIPFVELFERSKDDHSFIAGSEVREVIGAYRRCLSKLGDAEAENESLKAQLRPKCPDCLSVHMSHCSDPSNCGGVYWPDHMYRALEAERDKLLEVIREYRKGGKHHAFCGIRTSSLMGMYGPIVDDRCPNCIEADAMLPKEKQCSEKSS